jgi:hypothetical protein
MQAELDIFVGTRRIRRPTYPDMGANSGGQSSALQRSTFNVQRQRSVKLSTLRKAFVELHIFIFRTLVHIFLVSIESYKSPLKDDSYQLIIGISD